MLLVQRIHMQAASRATHVNKAGNLHRLLYTQPHASSKPGTMLVKHDGGKSPKSLEVYASQSRSRALMLSCVVAGEPCKPQ